MLVSSTLGRFFPVFGDGNTLFAVVFSSIMLWSVHFMILCGVKEAAGINTIVTIAKIVPNVVFVVVMMFVFDWDKFSTNFWGGGDYRSSEVFGQVRSTMLVTVFVFIGIEGASVYSR